MGLANLNENEALDVAKFAVDRDQAITDSGQVRIPNGAQVRALLKGFEIVQLREQDEHGPSYVGPKHWHVFHVIATKPHRARRDSSSG
jgi:hypothetical protein